jgi:hypothetical protein
MGDKELYFDFSKGVAIKGTIRFKTFLNTPAVHIEAMKNPPYDYLLLKLLVI